MASLIFNCVALLSPRLRRRRAATAEREREYAQNFEQLQAENEKRFKRLSLQQQFYNTQALTSEPPGYEEARKEGESEEGSSSSGEEEEDRGVSERQMTTALGRGVRPKPSMVDRRDWAVAAAAPRRSAVDA